MYDFDTKMLNYGMSKISIILPTYKRPTLLTKCITSILSTASNTANIEIMIGMEADDLETHAVLMSHPQNCVRVLKPAGNNFAALQNSLATASNPDTEWYFLMNDDCEVLTKDYDKLEGKHGYIHTWQTGEQASASYSEFPLVERRCALALGWLMPTRFTSYGSDAYIYNLYKAAGLVEESEIRVAHNRVVDEARRRMGARYNHYRNYHASPTEVAKLMGLGRTRTASDARSSH
jgi:hypothetical protein